ncbi:DUF4339 domain-containing protein [Colwellia sp. RE-S-Sl-9]
MKKWYFSDNGKVTGPYSLNDASSLLAKNNELYGWTSSFSQWLPVALIPELSEFISDAKPAVQVSKELIDKFVTKKRDLNKKVVLIDEKIKKTQAHINTFEKEINNYKNLTESLSSDVQDNILPLEKKYQLVTKQLKELIKASEISKHEIIDVVEEFGDLVLSKSNEDSAVLSELKELPELNNTADKVVQIKETVKKTPVKVSPPEVVKTEAHKTVGKSAVVDKTTVEKVVHLKESAEPNTQTSPSSHTDEPIEEKLADGENKAFMGVKNKFKSVFKPKTEEPVMRLSDQLKQLDKVPKEEPVFIDSDINMDDDLLEDNDDKKKRRRRRRF